TGYVGKSELLFRSLLLRLLHGKIFSDGGVVFCSVFGRHVPVPGFIYYETGLLICIDKVWRRARRQHRFQSFTSKFLCTDRYRIACVRIEEDRIVRPRLTAKFFDESFSLPAQDFFRFRRDLYLARHFVLLERFLSCRGDALRRPDATASPAGRGQGGASPLQATDNHARRAHPQGFNTIWPVGGLPRT